MRFPRPWLAVLAAVLLAACRQRETPEAAKARAAQAALQRQVAGLEELLAKARRGELVTADQIAVGIDEGVARELLNAALPQEQAIGKRIRVRIEAAEPFFRGNQATLLFHARATSPALPDQFAELELAGGLDQMKLVGGRLSAQVRLLHFSVPRASVGPLALGVVEGLVRENLASLERAVPPLEIPVHLDESVPIGAFSEGPVSVAGGRLPLRASISQVLALDQRLWVLVGLEVGEWQAAP